MIFHAAAFDTAGDIRVADVWESQEALDDFFNKRSLPLARQAPGAGNPPQILLTRQKSQVGKRQLNTEANLTGSDSRAFCKTLSGSR